MTVGIKIYASWLLEIGLSPDFDLTDHGKPGSAYKALIFLDVIQKHEYSLSEITILH